MCPLAGVEGDCPYLHLGPNSRIDKSWEGQKRNLEEMVALGRGQPWAPLARDAEEQLAGAGSAGAPRESQGQGLLKHTMGKS